MNSFIDYELAHQPNCNPYSQLLRIKRICSNEKDYQRNTHKKIEEFKEKNYPDKIIYAAVDKVNSKE